MAIVVEKRLQLSKNLKSEIAEAAEASVIVFFLSAADLKHFR